MRWTRYILWRVIVIGAMSLLFVVGSLGFGEWRNTWVITYQTYDADVGNFVIREYDMSRDTHMNVITRATANDNLILSPNRRFLISSSQVILETGVSDFRWQLLNAMTTELTILADESREWIPPIISPDSRHIAYYSAGYLYVVDINANGELGQVHQVHVDQFLARYIETSLHWSHDSQSIWFVLRGETENETRFYNVDVNGEIIQSVASTDMQMLIYLVFEWSPDGYHIIGITDIDAEFVLYRIDTRDPEFEIVMNLPEAGLSQLYWSSDQRYALGIAQNYSAQTGDIYLLDLEMGEYQHLIATPAGSNRGVLSPDGRYFALISTPAPNGTRLGISELYIFSLEDGEFLYDPVPIAYQHGGIFWSPDSHRVLYRSDSLDMTTIDSRDGTITPFTGESDYMWVVE